MQELDVKAGGGQTMTIGQMLRQWLVKLEWFSTLFPRIPVPIQQKIQRFLEVSETGWDHFSDRNREFCTFVSGEISPASGSGSSGTISWGYSEMWEQGRTKTSTWRLETGLFKGRQEGERQVNSSTVLCRLSIKFRFRENQDRHERKHHRDRSRSPNRHNYGHQGGGSRERGGKHRDERDRRGRDRY